MNTTWRGWLNELADHINPQRAASVSDRKSHRRQRRRPQLERLEDRIAPATDVTIVVGAAGTTVGGTFSASGVFTPTAATASVANGDIQGFLNAGTSVTINTASAFGNNGDITLANGASITKTAGANDSLTLNAVGAIIDSNATEPDITVTNLALSAGTGIAVGGALNTQVGNMVASTSTGGIFVNNTGDLTIGFTGNPFPGVMDTGASGDIVLTNAGTVRVNAALENIESLSGSVTVNATGATSDVLVSRGNIAGNGAIATTVTAGRDVIVDDFGLISAAISLAANNVTVTAARNVTLQATTDSGASISSGSGGITLTTGAGGTFTNNSGAGGGLFSSANGNITIAADDMVINDPIDAGTGIVALQQAGTTARNIDVGLGTTAGDLDISNVELTQVTASTLRIGRTDNAGNLSVTAALVSPGGANTLDLRSGGTITQTSGSTISVSNLAVQGAGGVSLGDNNQVSTLAGTASNNTFTFTAVGPVVSGAVTLTIGLVDGVNGVNAGTGNVNLTVGTAASTGILKSQFPNDGVADVTGGTVTLTALGPTNGNTGQIGFFTTSAQFFEVSATTLNASTDNSRLWISAIGGAAVGSINAGTNAAILKTVNGDLTSTHTVASGIADVTAGTVILLSPGASGSFGSSASPLEVQTSTLRASVSGAGSINVRNVAAGGNLAVPLASTANGDINLTVAGGNLTTTATTGTDISAPGHTVTLNASGAVVSGTSSGVTDVAAANLAVTAGTDVTLNNNNAVATLAGSARTSFQFTDSTNLTIASVAGVNGVITANGPINLTVTGGDLTMMTSTGTAISAPGNTVTLSTSAGIFSGTPSGVTDIAAASLAVTNASAFGFNPVGCLGCTDVAVKTAVGAFAASVGAGGVFMTNTSAALDIGTVSGINGVTAATGGFVTISTSADLSIAEAVSTTGAVTLQGDTGNGAGHINITAPITGSSATVLGGTGADVITVTITSPTPLLVNGQGGGDTLVFDDTHVFIGTVPGRLSVITAAGLESVLYSNIARINLDDAAAIDAFYGPDTADRATALAGLTADERFVEVLYLDALGRVGSKAELDGWAALFSNPNMTQTQAQLLIANGIEGSLEGRDHLVKSWYVHFLGRTAKGGEEIGWVNLLMAGQSEETVLSDILGSQEFFNRAQTLISSGTANQRYVQALYLVLMNRTGTSSEVSNWVNNIATIGLQGVAFGFLGSPEFRRNEFEGFYNALLHRPDDFAGLHGWVSSGLDFFHTRIDFEGSLEFFVNG